MAIVPDTTSVPITGKDGTADFVITGPYAGNVAEQSYECILDMFRVREVNEMTNADTFCVEGSADQEAGRSQLQFEISGVLKKNGPASGPLIPAPQNVPVKMIFSTGCEITFSANFTEAAADRVVHQVARMGGRGLSKGAYVVTWDRISP